MRHYPARALLKPCRPQAVSSDLDLPAISLHVKDDNKLVVTCELHLSRTIIKLITVLIN
ncbi:hypothetical protein LINGRAHAP2_LOCUS3213, partial [Linum grandiflorum]